MKQLIIVVILCFCPYLARADTDSLVTACNPPDVSGWTQIDLTHIELTIISNIAFSYIGVEVRYQNPANPNEFIRVIRRHIPLNIFRQVEVDERRLEEVDQNSRNQQEEQSRLDELVRNSDPIVYLHWLIKTNPRTGKNDQDGDSEVYLLASNGKWFCDKNEELEIEFLSENVGNGKLHNVFTGIKYQIGGVYHINRLDRNDLKRLFEKGRKP